MRGTCFGFAGCQRQRKRPGEQNGEEGQSKTGFHSTLVPFPNDYNNFARPAKMADGKHAGLDAWILRKLQVFTCISVIRYTAKIGLGSIPCAIQGTLENPSEPILFAPRTLVPFRSFRPR